MNTSAYKAATEKIALADFSHRGRWIVKGADANRFIHGQCTNDVNQLAVGQGCYACFLTVKGKLRGDGVIYHLHDSLGIETEPELSEPLRTSLERFVIADDVQFEDVTSVVRQGLVIGPKAAEFLKANFPEMNLPTQRYQCAFQKGNWSGDVGICLTHRADVPCYELFAAATDFEKIWSKFVGACRAGMPEGLPAADVGNTDRREALRAFAPYNVDTATLDVLRIEAGIPKFGVDMDENTIPIEAGLESRAISYTKGCYIGQEVISRIHSLGHVNRHLAKLRLSGSELPNRGDKIQFDGKDIGQVTSAVQSPRYGSGLALGYVRREHAKAGTKLSINNQSSEVIELCGNGLSV